MDIVEDIVVDSQPSTPSNPITDPQPAPEPESAASETEAEAKPEPEAVPKGVQKRIDRAVRQKYKAEARSEMLEERLAHLEQRAYAPVKPAAIDSSEPTIDKFDNFDDYIAAKAEFIADRKINQTLTEREQRSAAARETAERQKTVDGWGERVARATAEMPDFEEVLASSDVPMTEPMQRAIMESDLGPKLAYHLANNPDEAIKIAQMSPYSAVRALGRIEERLASAKQAVKATSTTAPITPVGSRTAVKKDPGKMSDAEYAKWRKQNAA